MPETLHDIHGEPTNGTARGLKKRDRQALQDFADRAEELVEGSLAMCTSLAPIVGNDQASSVEVRCTGQGGNTGA